MEHLNKEGSPKNSKRKKTWKAYTRSLFPDEAFHNFGAWHDVLEPQKKSKVS